MSKHECNVPDLRRDWRCPSCGHYWKYRTSGSQWLSTSWRGRDQVRNGDGSKLRWWQ
jgi:hypothetical protein